MTFTKSVWAFGGLLMVVCGCANTPCHMANAGEVKTVAAMPNSSESAANKVFVFKSDGSLQCGKKKSTPVKEMEKDLKDITVLSSRSENDGLMHVQMCGAATGKINVFEISEKDLLKAETLGFKKWISK